MPLGVLSNGNYHERNCKYINKIFCFNFVSLYFNKYVFYHVDFVTSNSIFCNIYLRFVRLQNVAISANSRYYVCTFYEFMHESMKM